ncbi:MAG: phosphoribosylformylglycinamidine synthase subunit PurQ, partial [Defluviitaleaceae bacterium]|nr:phosphoribosylformylglycinamidine synthase subunit PurQ [Defluviitaleaceae bacterium]
MKWAVIIFPGSNNDDDSLASLKNALGADVEYVRHDEVSLYGFDAIFVGGEASYGNYLRAGALAARCDIVPALLKAAADGVPVVGVGNGFHFLTEIGLLPGFFKTNKNLKFICKFVELKIENNNTIFTNLYERGE